MSTEANKEVVRRLHDALWSGEAGRAVIPELIDPGCVTHLWGSTRPSRKSPIYEAAFPDIANSLDLLVAEDDLVVRRWTNSGTHTGTFEIDGHVFAATGRQVQWSGANVYRLRNGKVVENWPHIDLWGLANQLR